MIEKIMKMWCMEDGVEFDFDNIFDVKSYQNNHSIFLYKMHNGFYEFIKRSGKVAQYDFPNDCIIFDLKENEVVEILSKYSNKQQEEMNQLVMQMYSIKNAYPLPNVKKLHSAHKGKFLDI